MQIPPFSDRAASIAREIVARYDTDGDQLIQPVERRRTISSEIVTQIPKQLPPWYDVVRTVATMPLFDRLGPDVTIGVEQLLPLVDTFPSPVSEQYSVVHTIEGGW